MVAITTLISSVAVLAGAVVAQAPNATFPNDIQGVIASTAPEIRNSWCVGEKTICGTLCRTGTDANQCDFTSLTWNCTCSSNHSSPALQYYENTIVYNICTAAKGTCMATNAGDLTGQQNCNSTYVCGTVNATLAAAAASSAEATTSIASSTAGPSSSATTPASAAATASSTGGAAAFGAYGQQIGTGAFAAGLLGFAAML